MEAAAVECGVYMAPSTLGVANMGIYTGIPLQANDVLNYPEIVVPLMFREWHDHGDNDDGSLWDRYIWEGSVVDMEPLNHLLDQDSSKAGFIPGVGCTINSRLDLKNIESTSGSVYDTAGVKRSDVGAGAFSPYHSSKTVAAVDMPAGSEIFAEYGYEWIPQIPGAIVTLDEYMDKADDYLQEHVDFVEKALPSTDDAAAAAVAEGLWNFTTHFPIHSDILNNLPKDQSWSTVVDAVHSLASENENNNDDDDDDDEDSSPSEASSVVRQFHRQHGRRELEWLQQHGKCQDHLRPGLSTLPHAGRGAFATRDLPKGTVVGYAPLIHMGNNRELWEIEYTNTQQSSSSSSKERNEEEHSSIADLDTNARKRSKSRAHNNNKYVKQDLILNYSFGHRHSTLLLTPYGAMVNFINHSKEKANVKVVWPDQELIAHKPEWLGKNLDFLIHTIEKIGLSFDYVALRDIKEGEEVFLDYGDEWQAAWEEHVRNWVPPANADTYKHSTEWPKGRPLLTVKEQDKTPYPSNLVTICIASYSHNQETDEYVWTPIVRKSPHRVHCDVLHRRTTQFGGKGDDDDDSLYTVRYKYSKHDTVVVHDVPREGIELTDGLFTADWHMEEAFRHEIMIPDDMFPEGWKNRKELKFQYPDGSANDEL